MNSMTEGALRLLGILALAIIGSSIAIGTAVAPFALAEASAFSPDPETNRV